MYIDTTIIVYIARRLYQIRFLENDLSFDYGNYAYLASHSLGGSGFKVYGNKTVSAHIVYSSWLLRKGSIKFLNSKC